MKQNKMIILFVCLLILIISASTSQNIFKPLNIKIDLSNIKEEKGSKKLQNELLKASKFLSELFYSNNRFSVSFDIDEIKHCDPSIKTLKWEKDLDLKVDILIFPFIVANNGQKLFIEFSCSSHGSSQPYLAVLEINNIYKRSINKNIQLFRLKLLKSLTKLIGFDHHIFNSFSIPNLYFKIPKYVTDYFYYSKSIKKYYNFTDTEMPKIKLSEEVRETYRDDWAESIGVPDYMRKFVEENYSVTELTTNLLRELSFFRINRCDFELFNNRCIRFDKKCINYNELFNDYFIEYHYNYFYYNSDLLDKKTKIKNDFVKCHLNTKENLKLRQCGTIEGTLVNHIWEKNFCINFELTQKKLSPLSTYDIPEFNDLNFQKLSLVTPSKACPNKHPRTIFFRPINILSEKDFEGKIGSELVYNLKMHENKEKARFKIEDVTITDKKYFVSFISYTRYELIVKVLEKNGIIRSYFHYGNHNMLAIPPSKFDVRKLQKYQLVYKREGNHLISNKYNLYNNFKKMQKQFPEEYDYMPITYPYPQQKSKIKELFTNYKQKKGNLWLIKPKNSSEGTGIHMFKSLDEEEGSYLITKYIENPHLIKGKKYDFRIYVLLTSVNPLSIYVYKQGLVRFASEEYSLEIDKLNLNYIHLTNTIVNKKNKEYIFNESINSEKGNKWSLHAYKKYCQRNNINFKMIMDQINDKVIKTILSIYYGLSREYTKYDTNYHNLFGFDFLLDSDFKIYLLEVNDGPSLGLYDNMDKDIKTKLMADTFNLIGIVPFAHDESQKPLDEIYEYSNKIEEDVDYALCEYARPKGKYLRVFPVKGQIEKYKKFFTNISSENKLLWEKIEKQEDKKEKKKP